MASQENGISAADLAFVENFKHTWLDGSNTAATVLMAYLVKRQVNEDDQLRGKLRSVISHATGGSFHDENASLDTICVEITRVRNHIYEAGQEAGRKVSA